MTFRTVAGSYNTVRQLAEGGLVTFLQDVVANDRDLAGLFGYESRFRWGGRNKWPIVFENTNDSPAVRRAKEKERPWFMIDIMNNGAAEKGIGRTGFARAYFVVMVYVFTRKGTGTERARSILDVLSEYFKDLNPETRMAEGVDLRLSREDWIALTIRQPGMENIAMQNDEKWHKMGISFEVEVDLFYQA